jgi:hypothetical protein
MMQRPPKYSRLLRLAGTLFKYYLLSWFCLGVICLVLAGIGAFQLVGLLLSTVGLLLMRLAIFLFCFIAIAAAAEAWRHW